MTKAELVSHIAEQSQITKKAAALVIDALVQTVHDAIRQDGEIRISDLGTFRVVQRKARAGVNPRTRKKIKIPATLAPTFRASKALKVAVKKAK